MRKNNTVKKKNIETEKIDDLNNDINLILGDIISDIDLIYSFLNKSSKFIDDLLEKIEKEDLFYEDIDHRIGINLLHNFIKYVVNNKHDLIRKYYNLYCPNDTKVQEINWKQIQYYPDFDKKKILDYNCGSYSFNDVLNVFLNIESEWKNKIRKTFNNLKLNIPKLNLKIECLEDLIGYTYWNEHLLQIKKVIYIYDIVYKEYLSKIFQKYKS